MRLIKKLNIILLVVVAFCFTTSCTNTRAIYDIDPEEDSDIVDVVIDIDDSEMDLDGVDSELGSKFTLILYPVDGSEPSIYIVDVDDPTVSVKMGDYSAIIFNGQFDSYTGILFSDIESYHTIKVVSNEADYDLSYCHLYSDTVDSVSVQEETCTLSFSLTEIFTTMHITTYISSINQLSEDGNYAIVDGLASGIYLSNRAMTLDDPISVNMPFTIFTYNAGSTLNGYVRGQLTCFGIYESEDGVSQNNADLYLMLKDEDAGNVQFSYDITDSIKVVDNDAQVLSVEISNIEIE